MTAALKKGAVHGAFYHNRCAIVSLKIFPKKVNLHDYIATGILEKYVLGLASPQEITEVEHLRRLSPEIRTELTEIEKRMEHMLMDTPVQPPVLAFHQIVQRLDWEEPVQQEPSSPPHEKPMYTLLSGKTMTISIWWRCAFVAAVMLAIVMAVAALYFYQRAHVLEQMLWQR